MSRGIGATEDERDWKPLTPTVPETWTQVDFEQAFDTVSVNNKKVPAKTYLSEGLFPVIDQGQVFIGGYTNDSTKAIDPGEDGLIVFGDHTRIFKRVTFPFAPGADGTKILRPTLSSSAYAYYACLSLQFPNKGYSRHYSYLCKCKFPVAPKPEQERIVSKIDELFSEIGEGERALERVQKLVERHRQSVLKAAVTGELTRDWREKRRKSLESGDAVLRRIREARGERGQVARDVVTDFLGPLPSNWTRVRVDEAGEVQLGRQRAPSHHQGANMRPYLRVANVFEERIDISDVMSMNFTPKEYVRYALRENDILLNEGQSKELVGRPAMYKGEFPGSCFTNTLVRFRAIAAVLPEFALIVFLHYMKSGQFQRIAKITTNIAHLGAERFAQMAFPVPPLEEQGEIVSQVRNQSDAYARLTEGLAVQERQAHALRQSVLKAAFSGTLVAQNTAEEAASSLLERIATDFKTSAVRPRAGRKRRAV